MPSTGPFSVKIDFHGAYLVADRGHLCSACMSDGEVAGQVRRLKKYLDQVAVEMRQAIKDREGMPVFDKRDVVD